MNDLGKLVKKVESWTHAMPVDASDAVTEMIDAYETELVRWRSRAFHAEGEYKRWYEMNRLLENRVRNAAKLLPNQRSGELVKIAKRLPNEPRKKLGWRMRVSR